VKVLGIDPGFRKTGYAVIKKIENKILVVEYGLIKTNIKESPAKRLMEIFKSIDTLVKDQSPDLVAIETIYSGKNYQSLLKLGQARAAAIIAASINGVDIEEFAPRKIKKIITGKGNASKLSVKYMVEKFLNISLPEKELDISDACAIALGCLMNYD